MPEGAAASVLRSASAFELEFIGADGAERCGSLARCWSEPFERALPVRSFPSFKGQKNFTGLYWAASCRSQVGYESWSERDAVMALDFDPMVVGLASQPFRLAWRAGDEQRGHVPDYFARLADGTGVVIDVRPADLVDEAAAAVFAKTAEACEMVGWQFRQAGDLDRMYAANLRWLSRYRHRRCHQAELAACLREVFADPLPLFAGADRVGDRLAVLPVLYHLIWQHVLAADLTSAPLLGGSLVSLMGGSWQ